MHYLALLPSLITSVVLSIIDVQTRTVPRVLVSAGVCAQILVFLAFDSSAEGLIRCGAGLAQGLAAGGIQLMLCLLLPTAIGLGDAHDAVLLGLAVGYWRGIVGIALWWFLMGALGVAALGAWRLSEHQMRRRHGEGHGYGHNLARGIPFVPVMSIAAAISVVVG